VVDSSWRDLSRAVAGALQLRRKTGVPLAARRQALALRRFLKVFLAGTPSDRPI
jgi:hypothetical protein